ncbi:hypothetical protein BGW37DRAFT_495863 [Umbelopsis sp. PMI_123]|nr:hypothetical protein BGW37DRAFT_495863 [Umbelopsis sp. PMI_123]
MSTLTSLSVNKGSTRFAPKVKPRINRAPTDATKQSNEAMKPISSQNNTESGKEKEKEKFSSGRIAKLPVKVTKPQNTTPIIPPISSVRDSPVPPNMSTASIPTVQTTSTPIVVPSVTKAAHTAIPTVVSAPATSTSKPNISVRSKIDKARAAASLGKQKTVEEISQTKETIVKAAQTSSSASKVKGKEKDKGKSKAAVGKQKVTNEVIQTKDKAAEFVEKSSSENQSKRPDINPMSRAVRAGTRLPIIRNKEVQIREAKGKEKVAGPMSRAVRAVDGWNPINARRKPAAAELDATPDPKPKGKAAKAKASASNPKSKTKKAVPAAKKATVTSKAKAKATPAEKATAKKITTATKRTVSRKQPATADTAEASTSASATKKATARKLVVRKAIKRKPVPIVPLKKRKIPVLRTPKPKPLPPPLITLDEIQGDPMNDDFLDRPMSDFIKDDKKGIVSKMFKEFEEARLAKKRKREETPHHNAVASTSQAAGGEVLPDIKKQKVEEVSKSLEDTALQESSYAPQLQFVNGKMVLDTASLAIKRSAMATDLPTEAMEVVEETSMSRVVNSQSYGKKSKSMRWSAEETERFYNALAQWGTDFEMITRLFPERTRKQIKLKFVKEERVAPTKVTDYLIRKSKPVGESFCFDSYMDHYMNVTGRTFNSEMKNMDVDFNNLVPEKMEVETKGETSTTGTKVELEARVPDTEPEEEVLGYVDD